MDDGPEGGDALALKFIVRREEKALLDGLCFSLEFPLYFPLCLER